MRLPNTRIEKERKKVITEREEKRKEEKIHKGRKLQIRDMNVMN